MGAYMRCNHCGALKFCENGLCADCASYLKATGQYSTAHRPPCPRCNGTGVITQAFGSATKCPTCNGTGKL